MSTHPGRILRDLMSRGTVMCPGAFNALVARAAAKAGFQSVYISGGATANVAGYPDIGLITLTEMTRTIREIVDACRLPVIVDADTGYGEVECVVRATVEYERAGAAGLHLEDRVFPMRCGHLEGKSLITAVDMAEKVAAAAEYRLSKDFLIIARTDARSVKGMQEAIDRANLYRQAGADMIFPEGLESEAEFAEFAKASPGLLLANMTEFGKTPLITAADFHEMGYEIVIFPMTAFRVMLKAVSDAYTTLLKEGTQAGFMDKMKTRQELYELIEYPAYEALDQELSEP